MEDKSYESKLSAPAAPPPTWLVNSSSVRPPAQAQTSSSSSFLNNEAHQPQQVENQRKWCGCEPGSQCVKCSFLHLPSAAPGSAGGRQGVGPPPPLPPAAAMALAGTQLQHGAVGAATILAEVTVGGSETHGNESMLAVSVHQRLHQQQQELSHGHGQDHSPAAAQAQQQQQQQQGRASLLELQQSDTANSSDLVDGEHGGCPGVDYPHHHHKHMQPDNSHTIWQNARLKADISMHPLYDQLLQAHVACLRIATPVDQLPRIDAQISQASQVLAKYAVLGQNPLLDGEEKEELDQFMTHYMLLLCTFKEQLQQHVRVHAMEAVMACWDLEQLLLSLTGVSPGEGTGATMSDDDDDPAGDSDPSIYDTSFDAHDCGAFGPLIPTETERSLMERVRQELKNELKSGYKDRIVDVREEILRKRRAGKLPGDTTSVLKAWWQAHSKWPYPTEDEKSRLVQETGLQLKQINNWFINQRKRNWHSNPSSTTAFKNKRKR